MTYRLPAAQLPGVVAGRADAGTYLGMALLFGFEEALEMFRVDLGQLGTDAEAIRCVGDAVETTNIGTRPSVEDVSNLAKAVLSCVSTFAVETRN
jgi:hypothetical protein